MELHCNREMPETSAELRVGLEQYFPLEGLFLGQIQHYRDKLLEQFGAWLEGQGLTIDVLLDSGATDIETLNLVLEKYGRALHAAGRPYGHYSETINGVVGKKLCWVAAPRTTMPYTTWPCRGRPCLQFFQQHFAGGGQGLLA